MTFDDVRDYAAAAYVRARRAVARLAVKVGAQPFKFALILVGLAAALAVVVIGWSVHG